jgi:hypothetical protein
MPGFRVQGLGFSFEGSGLGFRLCTQSNVARASHSLSGCNLHLRASASAGPAPCCPGLTLSFFLLDDSRAPHSPFSFWISTRSGIQAARCLQKRARTNRISSSASLQATSTLALSRTPSLTGFSASEYTGLVQILRAQNRD